MPASFNDRISVRSYKRNAHTALSFKNAMQLCNSNKKMACHNSFDVELLYITKTPNRRCLSTKTPAVTTKTPVVTTKTPLGNN